MRQGSLDESSLSIAYVMQGRYDPRSSRAAELHSYYLIRALRASGARVTLVMPWQRGVLCTEDVDGLRSASDLSPFLYDEWTVLDRLLLLLVRVFGSIGARIRVPYSALGESITMTLVIRRLYIDGIYERFNLMSMAAALTARMCKLPHLVEFNGDMLSELEFQGRPLRGVRRWWANWTILFCTSTATKIVAVTDGLATWLTNRYDLESDKLIVVPNGVACDTFPEHSSEQLLETHHSGKHRAVRAIFVGGFYDWHDVDVLLRALTHMQSSSENFQVLLIGDGPNRRDIVHAVNEAGLSDIVKCPGELPHDRVVENLCASDIGLALFKSKGWSYSPLKVFEYMAAGLAIVCSNLAGLDDIFRDGENGILVTAEDHLELASVLDRLVEDVSLRKTLGRRARTDAETLHDWRQSASIILDAYSALTYRSR